MSIEIQFNSVTVEPQEMQEKFPELYSAISSYLPRQKVRKRSRGRKMQKTATALINDIIDSINTE